MNKTANELFYDMQVRHAVHLHQYSSHILNRINSLLNKSEQALEEKLLLNLPKVRKGGETDWVRLAKLLDEIKQVRSEVWGTTYSVFEEELVTLAKSEPASYVAMLETALPVVIATTLPQAHMLKAIATSRPFQGKVLRDWALKMEADDIGRIHQSIQIGMTLGETTPSIVKRIIGSSGAKGTDGITQMTRNQVEAVTRTAVQHVANSAKEEFLKLNSDVIGEDDIYISVLDSRTTPGCKALDHKTFKRNTGPRPPLHFRCRGIRLAVLDAGLLGDRPANPTTRKILLSEYAKENNLGTIAKRDDLSYGTKTKYDKWERARIRELVGPVPSSKSYNSWLKEQSAIYQEETLGKAKAKLFRDGGLDLDKFVDRNYQPLTLKELAAREAEAFRRAGLDPKSY